MAGGWTWMEAGWPTTLALAAASVGTAPLAGLARTDARERATSMVWRRRMTASGEKAAGLADEPRGNRRGNWQAGMRLGGRLNVLEVYLAKARNAITNPGKIFSATNVKPASVR